MSNILKPVNTHMHPKYDKFLILLNNEVEESVGRICQKYVLDDITFQTWPASPNKHHTYEGGLFDHTLEVVQAALGIINLNFACGKTLNKDAIVAACVFHDYGKIFDYDKIVVPLAGPTEMGSIKTLWVKNEHYQKVHHIVKSYSYFLDATADTNHHWVEEAAHCILAHHGKLEYGSPVVPCTQEAWTVHLADMISVQCIEKRQTEQPRNGPR